MNYNEIDNYTHNILKKQLQKLKVNNYGLYKIEENVRNQLSSIIKNWNNTEFINAIFMTVTEEGSFYEPLINPKLGNLVVLGIRNSLLETIASINYKDYGLKEDISIYDIKNITTSAVEYFSKLDLNELSKKIEIEEDYYKQITEKYPAAYKALIELSKCSIDEPEREYKKVDCPVYMIENLDKELDEYKSTNYENGISEEFNDSLLYLLKGIKDKTSSLIYFDSFKYLSRNFEKNMKVLEFTLTNDGIFITNNFYISNNYVSRRKNLIRASHGSIFNKEAIKTLSEISNKYEKELKLLEIQIK